MSSALGVKGLTIILDNLREFETTRFSNDVELKEKLITKIYDALVAALQQLILSEPQTSSKPLPWSGTEIVRNSALPGKTAFVSSCATLNEPHLCGGCEPIEGQGPEITQDQIEAMERGGK